MTFPKWYRGKCFVLTVLFGVLLALGACEATPQDKMREARGALLARNADLAEERLQEALAADPDLFEARRLMANVHVLRKDFEKAETALQELWAAQGLDSEGELTDVQRQQRVLIRDQFNDLYRQWVEAVDPKSDPETFEAVVLKGLERDGRNTRFNALLVDFYQERAERFVERNEKVMAAVELEKIEGLRTFPDVRREARERARNLRREAFGAEARQRFEENILPGLIESGSYDPETETIRLAVDQTVDRRIDPANDEGRAQARTIATRAMAPTIAQLAISLTALKFENINTSKLTMPEMSVVEENFRRGRVEMIAAVKLDNLIAMAFEYAEYERTRPEEVPEEKPVAEEGAEQNAEQGEEATAEVDGP